MYQMNYILVKKRNRKSVKNACSYPGADVDSDHNLVVMNQTVTLKKLRRKERKIILELEKLRGKS